MRNLKYRRGFFALLPSKINMDFHLLNKECLFATEKHELVLTSESLPMSAQGYFFLYWVQGRG
jgi:hypothetical protein